ncbi:hypothetical protein SAMN04488026_10677 [Aliiruegeria lutimaris]|uniref:Uncharacterized protein n=1 Tax=Aliiruegeria lutimaris TaxID=571298 RepID=A0A1G9H9B0_9RHOB|nr:hypothetical protein SAMN04488026_10677 [Aliiruegeria lutimaris]
MIVTGIDGILAGREGPNRAGVAAGLRLTAPAGRWSPIRRGHGKGQDKRATEGDHQPVFRMGKHVER